MGLFVERSLVSARLPARWQLLLHRSRSGLRLLRTPGCGPGEVGVIAQVRDVRSWHASPDLRPGVEIGPAPDGRGALITARVALANVERVLADPRMIRIEPAQPLRPLLEDATIELAAQTGLLPAAAAACQGAGAWIGMVDSALPLRHGNFRESSGRPRLAAYWQQSADSSRSSQTDYGAAWERRELWVSAEAAWDRAALLTTHAMQMLDLAAGNGLESGVPGIAPRAEIAHVDLCGEQGAKRRDFGDTVRLLEGMKFVFNRAGDAPCAVNVSLGTNAGPHDGTTLVEQAMDVLATSAAGRAVIVAAGNSHAAEQHASAQLSQGDVFDLVWNVPVARGARHSVEIWYAASDELALELIAPRGQGGCRVQLEDNARLVDEQTGRTVALVAHQTSHANGGRSITIFLERGAPAGTWTARLRWHAVSDGLVHAWIVPEDAISPVFLTGADHNCTLNGLACGQHAIVAGAFDASRPHLPLAWYTSAGPTRDGRPKPDVSAPGHRVWVARADRGESSQESSGTSLAAAAVTGVAALVFAHAHQHGLRLSSAELAEILTATMRAHPPAPGWDPRYGHGRVDAAAALARVEELLLRGRTQENCHTA